MLLLLLRAISGGALMALVPLLARTSGPTVAGLIMMAPVVTLVSLSFVQQQSGSTSVSSVALIGLVGLVPLAVFLVLVAALAPRVGGYVAMAVGVLMWAAIVLVLYRWPAASVAVLAAGAPAMAASLAPPRRGWVRAGLMAAAAVGLFYAGLLAGTGTLA